MKLTFNPNFKFTFITNAELDRAEATGRIDDYDIVRINILNADGCSLDYPVKTLQAYKEEINKINDNSYIVEANVYASTHYFDIFEYD